MNRVATRDQGAQAPPRELWKSVPLEFAMSAAAVFLAAGLKLAGLLP